LFAGWVDVGIGRKKVLLLVEDEQITAIATRKLLEKYGFVVIAAYTGEEAVAIALHNPSIDLVLMDIDLGDGLDGTAAAKIILEKRDLPLIFLSAHTEQGTVEKTEDITSYGYIVKNTGATVLIASIKMAFKLYNAHSRLNSQNDHLYVISKRLDKFEEAFRDLFENSPFAILIVQDNFIKLCNPVTVNTLGYELGVIYSKPFDFFIHPDDAERIRVNHFRRLAGENVETGYDFRAVLGDGSSRWLTITSVLIDWFGKPATLDYIIDVTEEKITEKALVESEAKLGSILGNMSDGIWSLSWPDLNVLYLSPSIEKIYGYKLEDFLKNKNLWQEVTHPDYHHLASTVFKELLAKGFSERECLVIRADGEAIWVNDRSRLIYNDEGLPVRIEGTCRDITAQKDAELSVAKQLRDKAVLFKGAYRRFNETLFFVERIIDMQIKYALYIESRPDLISIREKISGVRLIYDKLLISDSCDVFSAKDYLEGLIAALHGSISDKSRITLIKNIDDFEMKNGDLLLLGIIIHELFSNIIKHALNDNSENIIDFRLTRKGSFVSMSIKDNGTGLPDGFDTDFSNGFGLFLVNTMSEQLNGHFSIKNKNGTYCTILFKV